MVQFERLVRKKLGEILVEEGLIKEDQVQEALRQQKASGDLLGEALIKLGYLTEADIAWAIVKQFGLPYIDASRYQVPKDVAQAFPSELMWQNRFIVLDKIGGALIIALSGVFNAEVFEKFEKLSGGQVFIYVSTSGQVLSALQRYYPQDGGGGKKP